jgi:hypothetical protein
MRDAIAFESWAGVYDGCESRRIFGCGWSRVGDRRGGFFNNIITFDFLD